MQIRVGADDWNVPVFGAESDIVHAGIGLDCHPRKLVQIVLLEVSMVRNTQPHRLEVATSQLPAEPEECSDEKFDLLRIRVSRHARIVEGQPHRLALADPDAHTLVYEGRISLQSL